MSRVLAAWCLLVSSLLPACAFSETARDWNGLVGSTGEVTYMASTTKVAFKLFVVIPFIGNVDAHGIVEDLTRFVADLGGDRVELVQIETTSYWYLLFPLTYIVTPVKTTLTAEFVPPPDLVEADRALHRAAVLAEEREREGG